jgi:ABC-type proline/glycine betaine transport system permease subunit
MPEETPVLSEPSAATKAAPVPTSSLMGLWVRLLTFRASAEDYEQLGTRHMIAGLAVCWLVGMGRYWDDTRATALQHAGVGSVVYVFVLAAVLWIVVKPIEPERFSYVGILTFITMTAPPAALYAIPVEKWMTLQEANKVNLYFLGIVALWRVGLWVHYLKRRGQFTGSQIFTCAGLPIAAILVALTALNLHHVVVNVMGGIREADKSSQDAAYGAVFTLSMLSAPVALIAGLSWLMLVCDSAAQRKAARQVTLRASSEEDQRAP